MSETTAIKEKPILFRAAMVRAILDGRKTQTRRILKMPKGGYIEDKIPLRHVRGDCFDMIPCPYGQPGDRLWVREAWATRVDCEPGSEKAKHYTLYAASCRPDAPSDPMNWHDFGGRWRPSIHMPRWASRITLEVTEVRVERLQEITEEDAKAEGVDREAAFDDPDLQYESQAGEDRGAGPGYFCPRSYVDGFRNLWEQINTPRGYGWDKNPWVWRVEFKPVPQEVRA